MSINQSKMAARVSVQLSTNWGTLERILKTTVELQMRDGTELPDQLSVGPNPPVVIECEGTAEPCFLFMDTFNDDELVLHSLEVVSECRNVEIYDSSNGYLGTAAGITSAEGNEDMKMYSCMHHFRGGRVYPSLKIKFVSLGGRLKFHLKRLTLKFREMTAQEKKELEGLPTQDHTWENQLELKELASLEGAPQGIKALVATMQHLSKQQRTGRFFTEEDKGEMPPNMQQALETLRSMRSSAKNEAEPDGSDEQDKASPQQVTKEDLERLENHLKTYIDNAVDRAQKSLEKKIDLLAGSLEVLVTQLINIKS